MDVRGLTEPRQNAPAQEYALYGSISEANYPALRAQLGSLCGDSNDFLDHEFSVALPSETSTQPVIWKIRKSILRPNDDYHVYYRSDPEGALDKNQTTLCFTAWHCLTNPAILPLLKDLGFQHLYDVVYAGGVWRKDDVKVTVSRLSKQSLPGSYEPNTLKSLAPDLLVEVSATLEQPNTVVRDNVRIFADSLRGLVQLDKLTPAPT